MRMNAKELIAEARVTAPSLPPAAAKLMSDMADRLDVQYAVIRESQAQLHAVVAEDAIRGDIIGRLIGQYGAAGYHAIQNSLNPAQSLMYDAMQAMKSDAGSNTLAALRAEGVEMAIKEALSVDTVASTGAVKFVLQDFANKLRQSVQVKGVQS